MTTVSRDAQRRAGLLAPWADVVIVLLMAAAIRLYRVDALGFTHWDEEFMVRNGRALAQDFWAALPRVGFECAPLTSVVFALVMKIVGVNDSVPFVVNAVAGAAAAAVCTSLGQRMFGRLEGLAAGALLATSMFAVSYSRLALVEPLFLLMTLVVLRVLWWAMDKPGAGRWLVFGVCGGLLILAKYSGAVILAIAGAWFALLGLREWARSRHFPMRTALGFAGGIAISGAVAFIGLSLVNPGGLGAPIWVLLHSSGYSPSRGNFRFLTTPETIRNYLELWVSPVVLAAAGLGLLTTLWKRKEGDVLLVLWLVGFGASLLLYKPFPRLALPLFPAVFLLAARSIGVVVSQVPRIAPGSRQVRVAVPSLAVLLIGISVGAEAVGLPRILRMRTTGYAEAARVADQVAGQGAEVWWRVQPEAVPSIYTKVGREIDEELCFAEDWSHPARRIFIVDHSEHDWHGTVTIFFDSNHNKLRLLATIPNPMYDELFLQPATPEALDAFVHRPKLYPAINVYESTDGLTSLKRRVPTGR